MVRVAYRSGEYPEMGDIVRGATVRGTQSVVVRIRVNTGGVDLRRKNTGALTEYCSPTHYVLVERSNLRYMGDVRA